VKQRYTATEAVAFVLLIFVSIAGNFWVAAERTHDRHVATRLAYVCGGADARRLAMKPADAAMCAALHDPGDTDPHAATPTPESGR